MDIINRQLSDYYIHWNRSRDQFHLGGGGVVIVIPRIEGQLASGQLMMNSWYFTAIAYVFGTVSKIIICTHESYMYANMIFFPSCRWHYYDNITIGRIFLCKWLRLLLSNLSTMQSEIQTLKLMHLTSQRRERLVMLF